MKRLLLAASFLATTLAVSQPAKATERCVPNDRAHNALVLVDLQARIGPLLALSKEARAASAAKEEVSRALSMLIAWRAIYDECLKIAVEMQAGQEL